MCKFKWLLSVVFLLTLFCANGQEEFPFNGVKDKEYSKYFISNGVLHIDPQTTLFNADLLIEDGKVIAVGESLQMPEDAILVDLQGTHHVYPGFIDLFSDYGMPALQKSNGTKKPQFLSDKKGAYSWNEALKTEFRSSEHFTVNKEKKDQYLAMGISTVLTQRRDGLSRGSASLVQLTDQAHEALLRMDCAHAMSFKKGSSSQDYPRSLMGAIALLKQTHFDALWQEQSQAHNVSLSSWNTLRKAPIVFETGNKWEAMNAMDIAATLSSEVFIFGSNDEYQRIEELKKRNAKLILPVSFPKATEIKSSFDLAHTPFAEMKHWELAPYNARMLYESDIPFCLSSARVKDGKTFRKNLSILLDHGLPKEEILRALTMRPAQWMGVEEELGSLKEGKIANFFISTDDFFESQSKIVAHFVKGNPGTTKLDFSSPLEGMYRFEIDGEERFIQLQKQKEKWSWVTEDSATVIPITVKGDRWRFRWQLSDSTLSRECIGHSNPDRNEVMGMAYGDQLSDVIWEARLVTEKKVKEEKREKTEEAAFHPFDQIVYPFQAYGRKKRVIQPENIVIKNATVWTNEEDGIIQADVWIQDGVIKKVGSNLEVKGVESLDARGKHLTSGIIDEHSHIAIRRGVNEGTQSSSAEVSIGDVIHPDDINIFRHLAGGVTCVQQLHGSANPIGGQSSIIKLRWGEEAEKMKVADVDGFIKFALGENVKQTNWGDHQTLRYPQTRMGVEQVFVDYFTRAREYDQKKKSGKPYRKDLEMEAIAEILNKERFITCHSYQQGEINMLMKVAEQFDFRINTFTHILEGYKLADKMKAHGVGASTFSDWWAYKYEVIDAIPYNAAILHKMGVVTAINSDDAEMGRRLNQEAAKIMKYGDIEPEEAWKMVTLNPAILLHLDDRMGSVREGKDADLVLWSGNPLSSFSQAELTFVDGIRYFDAGELEQKEKEIEKEKKRIADKMKADASEKKPVKTKGEKHYHCDDNEDELK